MSQLTIPCIDCILYAICRAQLLGHPQSPWTALVDDILYKCRLILDYTIQGSKNKSFYNRETASASYLLIHALACESGPATLLQEIENFLCNDFYSRFELNE